MRKILLSIIAGLFATATFAAPKPKSHLQLTPQQRQRDLDLDEMEKRWDLTQWYLGYNHTYFQDALPNDVVLTRDLNDDRFMAITFYDTGQYHIQINPKYNISTKQERINLLHESCHVLLFIEQDTELDDHGPHWQACMMRLADAGAFKDLW